MSVTNDGQSSSIWRLCCWCCVKDPAQEPLLSGDDPSVQGGPYSGSQQRQERPKTPDSALGRQDHHGVVAPLSPTRTSQSSGSGGSHSDSEGEIERPHTPDSAFGEQRFHGGVTGTSPQRV